MILPRTLTYDQSMSFTNSIMSIFLVSTSGICWFLIDMLSNINIDGQHFKISDNSKGLQLKKCYFLCATTFPIIWHKKVLVIEWYWAKQQQQIVIAKFSLVQVRKFQKAIVVSFNFQKN